MMMRGNAVFMLVIILPLLGNNIVAGGSRRRRQGHVLLKSVLYSRKLNKPVLSLDDEKTPTTAFDPSPKLLPQRGLKEKDRIKKLPGQPGWVNFAQYGGYVTVDEKAGRALFYYFVEALGPNPSSKPLLLWFNGGPGCSSLGYGAFEELGPFRVKSDGRTLFTNPYAWNAVANVLFLESPAGTGFSYSNTTSDYERSGDRRSAEDALVFLLNWLERFPEYKGSDFYIAGESYAGHFVPQFAQSVYQNNQSPHNRFINLKGLLMGNAVINHDTDFKGMYDYLWTHALISDESIDGIHKFCDFSLPDLGEGRSPRCKKAFSEADEIFGQQIDIYHIYAPVCASENITAVPRRASIQDFDPCTDYYVEAYLNRPEVQDALHANVTKLDYSWVGCSDKVDDWNDMPRTVLPLIRQLMQHGIRVCIYSGDVDGVIPVTASRYSINMLRLPVKSPWRPWSVRGEVCGYTVVYGGNLTFATVRGAGHEVPSYQPLRTLVLVKSFLNEKPLPRLANDWTETHTGSNSWQ